MAGTIKGDEAVTGIFILGSITYVCSIHASMMNGTIEVAASPSVSVPKR